MWLKEKTKQKKLESSKLSRALMWMWAISKGLSSHFPNELIVNHILVTVIQSYDNVSQNSVEIYEDWVSNRIFPAHRKKFLSLLFTFKSCILGYVNWPSQRLYWDYRFKMQLNLKSITVNIKNIFLQIRFLFSPSQNKKVNMRLVPMSQFTWGGGTRLPCTHLTNVYLILNIGKCHFFKSWTLFFGLHYFFWRNEFSECLEPKMIQVKNWQNILILNNHLAGGRRRFVLLHS